MKRLIARMMAMGAVVLLASAAGAVSCDGTATIDFSDAVRAGDVQGKVYVLAEADSFDVPEKIAGWTFTPALVEGQGKPKLVVENGKLKLKMGIQPTILILH